MPTMPHERRDEAVGSHSALILDNANLCVPFRYCYAAFLDMGLQKNVADVEL